MNSKFLMLILSSMVILPTLSMQAPFPWDDAPLNKKALEEELDAELAPDIYQNPSFGATEIRLINAHFNRSELEENEQEVVDAQIQNYVARHKNSSDPAKRKNAAKFEFLSKTK
jgi:hypothetical protein